MWQILYSILICNKLWTFIMYTHFVISAVTHITPPDLTRKKKQLFFQKKIEKKKKVPKFSNTYQQQFIKCKQNAFITKNSNCTENSKRTQKLIVQTFSYSYIAILRPVIIFDRNIPVHLFFLNIANDQNVTFVAGSSLTPFASSVTIVQYKNRKQQDSKR